MKGTNSANSVMMFENCYFKISRLIQKHIYTQILTYVKGESNF